MSSHVEISHGKPSWKADSKQVYTVRSGYFALAGDIPNVVWWKLCWCNDLFPRHGFIMWLALLDRLHTKSRLLGMHMINVDLCVLCQNEAETRDHIFLYCPCSCEVAAMVWKSGNFRLLIFQLGISGSLGV